MEELPPAIMQELGMLLLGQYYTVRVTYTGSKGQWVARAGQQVPSGRAGQQQEVHS
jgi:hypothetical protein